MVNEFAELIYRNYHGKRYKYEFDIDVVKSIPKRKSVKLKHGLERLYNRKEVTIKRIRNRVDIFTLLRYCIDKNKYPYLVHKDFIAYKTVSIPFALRIGQYTFEELDELIKRNEYYIFVLNLNDLKKYEIDFEINDWSFEEHINELEEVIELYKQRETLKLVNIIRFWYDEVNTFLSEDFDGYIIQPVHSFIVSQKIFPYYGFLAFDRNFTAYRLLTSEGHCNINFYLDCEISAESNSLCFGENKHYFLPSLKVFSASNSDSRYSNNFTVYPVSTMEYLLKSLRRYV